MSNNTNRIVLLVLCLLLAGCGEDNLQDQDFPERSSHTAYLADPDSVAQSGAVRVVEYADDGLSPVREHVTLPDGSERVIFFRPEFKIWRVFEYFAGRSASGEPILRSEAVFEEDGKSLHLHTAFSANGERLESGMRTIQGQYRIRHYFPGTEVAQRVITYSADNKLEAEELFRQNGTAVTAVKRYKKGIYDYVETTFFDESGLATHRHVKADGYTDRTEVFFPGTTEIEWEISRRYGLEITRFAPGSKRLRKWDFDQEKMKVLVYNPATGKSSPLYTQFWNRVGHTTAESTEAVFELDAIREFDYEAPDDTGMMRWRTRTVEFDIGSSIPNQLVFSDLGYGGPDKTEYLDEDGKVFREKVKEDDPDSDYSYDKIEVSRDIDPPRDPEQALDPERFRYVGFQLPEFIELPITIRVRDLK